MRAINHALTGATIGLLVDEPIAAVPLSLVSHYVCDVIPHYGAGLPEEQEINTTTFRVLLALDFILCVALVVVLALKRPKNWLLAAICAFVATSPDLASIGRYRAGRKRIKSKPNRYVVLAKRIQLYEKPPGAVVEVVWFASFIIILSILIKR